MARQLTPLGRFLFVLAGLSLLGYGFYKYSLLAGVAGVPSPQRCADGASSTRESG